MPDNNSVAKGSEQGGAKTLTPELVRQVTDEVYKLLVKDLNQENERRRIRNSLYRR